MNALSSYAEISLTRGYKTIVDEDMFEVLSKLKWHVKLMAGGPYAARTESTRTQFLHWYIVGKPFKKGFVIDHINGQGLDNRRNNLRIVTHRVNCRNFPIHRKGKLVGVKKNPESKINPWTANFYIGNKNIYIGSFPTKESAYKAYLEKCQEVGHGN